MTAARRDRRAEVIARPSEAYQIAVVAVAVSLSPLLLSQLLLSQLLVAVAVGAVALACFRWVVGRQTRWAGLSRK